MTPATLLSDLTARGVEFVAREDKLRFRPVAQVTPDELVLIRQHKAVILKLLRSEGTEAGDNMVGAQVAVGTSADDPVVAPAQVVDTTVVAAWPIIEGTEHFSLWVDDPDGDWPEFIPGHHYDIRQASRLRGLLSPKRVD
jgi:hypothetical protein